MAMIKKFSIKPLLLNWILLLISGGTDSNKGKSKKWKKILQFPHISQCVDLKPLLGEFQGWIIITTTRILLLFKRFNAISFLRIRSIFQT